MKKKRIFPRRISILLKWNGSSSNFHLEIFRTKILSQDEKNDRLRRFFILIESVHFALACQSKLKFVLVFTAKRSHLFLPFDFFRFWEIFDFISDPIFFPSCEVNGFLISKPKPNDTYSNVIDTRHLRLQIPGGHLKI